MKSRSRAWINPALQKRCSNLQLSSRGLVAVRALLDHQGRNPEMQILQVLEEIGLQAFIREAWVYQDQEVSQQFVDNLNFQSHSTTVHGIHIDLDLGSFLEASGFKNYSTYRASDRSNSWSPAKSSATRCAALFAVPGVKWKHASIASCKDELVRELLALLSTTIWFSCVKRPSRAPRDLVNLVLEALDGAEFNWADCIYYEFVAELKRLQTLRHGSHNYVLTHAGPLMYFLYVRSKLRPESASQFLPQVASISQRLENTKLKTLGVSKGNLQASTYGGVLAMRLKSEDCLELVTQDLPTPSGLRGVTPTRSRKRSRSETDSSAVTLTSQEDLPGTSCAPTVMDSTKAVESSQLQTSARIMALEKEVGLKNEEMRRLQLAEINSKLNAEKMEWLYLEEQRHVQECMKLHFGTVEAQYEEEVAELKARVRELEDEVRACTKRESILELQLSDIRKRWESAAIRAELAEIQAAEKSCLLLRSLCPNVNSK
ncbi:hypothetical protein R1flu_000911 [Riccia fluitans]|uniref:Uncharacterized protein n=1 Tax=Riccia fluitans TaxID=41844 RepID=A0ABD1Y1S9_9MARC